MALENEKNEKFDPTEEEGKEVKKKMRYEPARCLTMRGILFR